MPENTVKVDRSTKWGNPFVVGEHGTRAECVQLFEYLMGGLLCVSNGNHKAQEEYITMARRDREQLRGQNLACWCPLDAPCHADVLLMMSNVQGDRRCAASSRSVQKAKRTGSTAGLARILVRFRWCQYGALKNGRADLLQGINLGCDQLQFCGGFRVRGNCGCDLRFLGSNNWNPKNRNNQSDAGSQKRTHEERHP